MSEEQMKQALIDDIAELETTLYGSPRTNTSEMDIDDLCFISQTLGQDVNSMESAFV